MELVWLLPSYLEYHKSKPSDLIGHVLGHEGKGSVLSALKQAGLATDLSAGADHDDHTTAGMLFSVNVTLTERGLQDVDAVCCCVLACLGLLARMRTPERWLHDEIKDVAALNFRFQENDSEIEHTRRLSLSMQSRFDAEATLSGDVLYSEYRPDLIMAILQRLTPATLTLFLSSTDATQHTEPWFETRYAMEPVESTRSTRLPGVCVCCVRAQ